MVRAAKTAYRIKQLQSTNTKTIWKTLRHHNTHHRPIPPLEGQTDFKAKCASLRNALFPAVNNLPRQQLPPNFLSSKFDLSQQTHPITTREVSLAITHLTQTSPPTLTWVIPTIRTAAQGSMTEGVYPPPDM
jgi:hypothetical protein